MPRPESFGFAALALGQSMSQFNAFMPPLADVRRSSPSDPVMAGDVRTGEVASLVGSLLVGAVVGWITGDPTAAYVSVIICAVMVGMYEYIFRANRPMET